MQRPGSWRMRELTADDTAEVGELFRLVMGFARAPSHNRWKFVDNPVGPPLGMLAVDGERIVGQYALWPVELRLGREVVLGAQSLDTMTHPDYQGQGMFTKLANACMEVASARGVVALYGFPNPNSYPGFVKKLNWDHTGDIQGWARLLRPGRHPRIPKGLRTLADLGASLLPRGRPGDFEIALEAPPDDALAALVASTLPPEGCCIHRTVPWMKWRFDPASAMQYEWVTVRERGAVVAAAVWGIDMVGGRGDGKLAEIHGERPQAVEAALRGVVARAKQAGCPILTTVTSLPAFTGPLVRTGFLRSRRIPLIVRTLTGRTLGANVHEHSSWRVLGSDLDTY